MTVLSADLIHDGRDGEEELRSDGRVVRRYTEVYRAITDSPYDEGAKIFASGKLPPIGYQYAHDPAAYLRRRTPVNISESKKIWLATCLYSTERELSEDPLADPIQVEWDSESYQIAAVKDRNNWAIVNTAGDRPDPPHMMDASRWAVTITANVAEVPEWIDSYRDVVNKTAFKLNRGGRLHEVPKGFAKLSHIHISDTQYRNDAPYYVFTASLHIVDLDDTTAFYKWDENEEKFVELEEDEFEHAHAIVMPNVGYRKKPEDDETKRVECQDANHEPVTSPVLLDEKGKQIDDPTPNDAVYVVWDVYREKEFIGKIPGCVAAS